MQVPCYSTLHQAQWEMWCFVDTICNGWRERTKKSLLPLVPTKELCATWPANQTLTVLLLQVQTYFIEVMWKDLMEFLNIQLLYHRNIFMLYFAYIQIIQKKNIYFQIENTKST